MRRNLIKWCCFSILLIAAFFLLSGKETAVFSEKEDIIIRRFATDKREVIILIETAFGDDHTVEILEVLKKHRAKACFAVMGLWAEGNPDSVNKIIENGHDMISHSMHHPHYSELSEEEIKKDMALSFLQLKELTAEEISAIYLPFCEEDERVLQVLFENGIVPIGCGIDSLDYTGLSSEKMAEDILIKIKGGEIILFRNNCENTAKAIDLMLTEMDKRHYRSISIKKILFE